MKVYVVAYRAVSLYDDEPTVSVWGVYADEDNAAKEVAELDKDRWVSYAFYDEFEVTG